MSRPPRLGRTGLSNRILVYYAITYLVLIAVFGVIVDRQVRNALVNDLVVSAESTARSARLGMPGDRSALQQWASEVFEASRLRVTVIDTDGVVAADSHSDPAVLENHAARPEVVQAVGGEVGTATRTSESTGFAQHYLALPPHDGLILRVSVSEREVSERLAPIRWSIAVTAAAVGLLGVAVVAVLAGRMARPIARIKDTTLHIAGGDLSVRPARSPVREIDDLGLAISQLADDLGRRLEQSELANETLEVVLGAIPQGTVLVGPDEEIVYANPPAEAMLGTVPETLSGLVPHPFQTAVRESRERQSPVDVVVGHGSPERRLHGLATPFAGDQRILLVVVDVTDRERAASIRRDFVANASHELKTPVSSITSSAEALSLAVGRNDPAAVGFASNIRSAANRLDRLVSDLLDLSRIERDSPEMEPLRFDRLVADVVSDLGIAEEGIDVAVDAEEATVMGNRKDLGIVIKNLVENAIRYTDSDGSVTLSISAADGSAVLKVADTGIGIPQRDLDRVFERFYRVDAARSRETGGTGLGLAIVRHAVEAHGGTVVATSELGVGSTFTVTLPLAT